MSAGTREADSALLAHIEDLLSQARRGAAPRFSEFLNEAAQGLVSPLLAKGGCPTLLYGGWEDAARRVLGVFAPGEAPQPALFPVRAFSAALPRAAGAPALTHRDFLGALLGLGIKREIVGDILVMEREAVFFVLAPAAPLVLSELCKVGRAGVRVREIDPGAVQYTQRFEERDATVASLRLDCVVAALLHCSRDEAAGLVETGLVLLEGRPALKGTRQVPDGARISVRGKGKFLVEAGGEATRKGRQRIHIKRYV